MHEWDSPPALSMPQEDLWTGRVSPPCALSDLEPVDAQEVCGLWPMMTGQSLGLSMAFTVTRGMVGRQGLPV